MNISRIEGGELPHKRRRKVKLSQVFIRSLILRMYFLFMQEIICKINNFLKHNLGYVELTKILIKILEKYGEKP